MVKVFVAGAEYKGPNTCQQNRQPAQQGRPATQQPAVSTSAFATPFSSDAHRSFDYASSSTEEGSPKVCILQSPAIGCYVCQGGLQAICTYPVSWSYRHRQMWRRTLTGMHRLLLAALLRPF
jgi:hypothetical protein